MERYYKTHSPEFANLIDTAPENIAQAAGQALEAEQRETPYIQLITPGELALLPNGTKLKSIFNEEVVVGVDHIDLDSRDGFLAYGLECQGDSPVQPCYKA